MESNKCLMCANFGEPKSPDRELRRKNTEKNAIFGLEIY